MGSSRSTSEVTPHRETNDYISLLKVLFATMPLFKVLFVTIYDSSFLLAIENLWIFQIFRDFLKKPNHRLISCVKALSIGNNIISSAIWHKYALINFSTKLHEPAGQVGFVIFEKFICAYHTKLQEKSYYYLLIMYMKKDHRKPRKTKF